MITAVAFCPHPPVLVPEVAPGAAPELDDLRAACREAITRVAAPGRALVVVGAGSMSRAHTPQARGTLAGYGVPLVVPLGSDEPGPVELPLSLTIGAWLLRDAEHFRGWEADLRYDAAPCGVGYFVATWT